jgi:YVTN family beta-propeller protein
MTAATQKFERDGIVVEFEPPAKAVAGEEIDLRFSLRGADGSRLNGVRPAAWIDARIGDGTCKDKIQSFLAGSLRARPQVDLNTYYVITLNVEPSVAVIDPLIGFGGSKLLTAVNLQSPGADWALSPDQKRLFVSMPLVNRVAVIDTEEWEVVQNVEAGLKPSRLSLQGDKLWAVGEQSVSVIDTTSFDTRSVPIGKGPHSLAFAANVAFVTNAADGTVTVIDPSGVPGSQPGTLRVGASPVSIAFSTLASSIYVADAGGTISVIDPAQRKVTKTITAKPGLTSIQFAPGGRWGFVTNEKESAVHVLDSSTASILTTATNVGAKPDQLAFTDEFAYIRAAGSDQVKMIRLAGLGSEAEPAMAVFPAGQLPPAAARVESVAAAIVPAPEPKSVLVANPADRLVYYYSEGMAAPMGNFSVHRRSPKAVLVIDRSLRESEPGVFSIGTKVAEEGTYDVAFFLNAPRVVHCFELAVASDGKPRFAERKVKIEQVTAQQEFRAGEPFELKFRLVDANSGEPHRGAKDVRALAFLAPGTWQKRFTAVPDAEGVYSINVEVPEEGIYYVFLEAPSLNLKINKARPLLFEAVANPGAPAHASSAP